MDVTGLEGYGGAAIKRLHAQRIYHKKCFKHISTLLFVYKPLSVKAIKPGAFKFLRWHFCLTNITALGKAFAKSLQIINKEIKEWLQTVTSSPAKLAQSRTNLFQTMFSFINFVNRIVF